MVGPVRVPTKPADITTETWSKFPHRNDFQFIYDEDNKKVAVFPKHWRARQWMVQRYNEPDFHTKGNSMWFFNCNDATALKWKLNGHSENDTLTPEQRTF